MGGAVSQIWKRFGRNGHGEPPTAAPASALPATTARTLRYTVHVDSNFHYMEEEQRRSGASYQDLETAVRDCESMVDRFLVREYRPGMTAEHLYDSYTSFGDDPFILPAAAGTTLFSAWTYARRRCEEICSAEAADPPAEELT